MSYIGKHPQSGNEVSRIKGAVGIFFDLSIRYLKPPVNKMTQNVLVYKNIITNKRFIDVDASLFMRRESNFTCRY